MTKILMTVVGSWKDSPSNYFKITVSNSNEFGRCHSIPGKGKGGEKHLIPIVISNL